MEEFFLFESFIDKNIIDINLKKKVSKKNRINLASNELIHTALETINKNLCETINLNVVNSYVYYEDQNKYFADRFKCSVDNIALFSGSDDAIKIILSSIGKCCGNMIIQTPNYENYYSYAKLNKIKIHKWRINEELQFSVNEVRKHLEQCSPSLVIITNPNGYTGKSMSINELEYILKQCKKYGHMLVIDCAYSKYDSVDYKILSEKFENLLLINSLSKSYGLPGARFAYIIGAKKIIDFISYWNGINAISSTTYITAKFYLAHEQKFDLIRKDIIDSRIDFITYINDFTPWEAINSNSNFVLIRMNTKVEAHNLYQYLYDRNFIIRDLSTNTYFEKYVRVTIGEKVLMEPIKTYISNFTKNQIVN